MGDVMFVVSSKGDKVSAASLDGSKLKSVKLSEPGDPPLQVGPVSADGLGTYTGLHQVGGKVRRLAVFTKRDWTWHTFELPEPASRATIVLGSPEVCFVLDSSLVMYSPEMNRWDRLQLSTPVDPSGIHFEHNPTRFIYYGHLYRYDSKTGKWSDLDTSTLLDQPDREPESTTPAPGQDAR